MSKALPEKSAADLLTDRVAALTPDRIPPSDRVRAEELLIDVVGLCVAARRTDYIKALMAAPDQSGPCTAIGHTTTFSAESAALINGAAVHGEDFDDTFEGGPVHSSSVIVPAVLAACERFGRGGSAALIGIAAGVEATCRLSMVVPKGVHKSGFHPTSVLGTMGAALAVSAVLGHDHRKTVDALGHSGSFAS